MKHTERDHWCIARHGTMAMAGGLTVWFWCAAVSDSPRVLLHGAETPQVRRLKSEATEAGLCVRLCDRVSWVGKQTRRPVQHTGRPRATLRSFRRGRAGHAHHMQNAVHDNFRRKHHAAESNFVPE